jgi:hypothetical protein
VAGAQGQATLLKRHECVLPLEASSYPIIVTISEKSPCGLTYGWLMGGETPITVVVRVYIADSSAKLCPRYRSELRPARPAASIK